MSPLEPNVLNDLFFQQQVQTLYTLTEASTEAGPFVATSDLKDWSRVDLSDDDTLIAGLQTAAVKYVENVTKLRMLRTTLTVRYNMVPTWDSLALPFGPFYYGSASDLTVSYTDSDGASQTFAASNYVVPASGTLIPRLGLKQGKEWPTLADQDGAVVVEYKAGIGVASPITGIEVEPLKLAVKMLVAHWYEHREAVDPVKMQIVPHGVDRILAQYQTQRAF